MKFSCERKRSQRKRFSCDELLSSQGPLAAMPRFTSNLHHVASLDFHYINILPQYSPVIIVCLPRFVFVAKLWSFLRFPCFLVESLNLAAYPTYWSCSIIYSGSGYGLCLPVQQTETIKQGGFTISLPQRLKQRFNPKKSLLQQQLIQIWVYRSLSIWNSRMELMFALWNRLREVGSV